MLEADDSNLLVLNVGNGWVAGGCWDDYLAVQDLTFKLFYVACLLIIVSLMLCMVKLPCNRQRCQAFAGARR